MGRIVEIDGKSDIGKWNTKEANEFKGTDGYWIPPFRTIHDRIWVHEQPICVSFDLKYIRKMYDRGIPLRTFSPSLDRFAANKAYCRENGSCPIQGTLDLFNCFGIPIIATLPHFLDTHPSLLGNVQSGLRPDRKLHEITCSIELVRVKNVLGVIQIYLFIQKLFFIEKWHPICGQQAIAIKFRISSNTTGRSDGQFTKHDIPIHMG